MKNALKSLTLLAVLGMLIFTTSCSDDDEGGIDLGGGGGSFAVADGLYIAGISGSDTTIVNAAKLSTTIVEDEGFGSQERPSFQRAWVFLEAGTYILAEVEDQKVTAVFGGVSSTVTVDPSNADQGPDSYKVVAVSENGSAFELVNSGVHFISYDALLEEALLIEIGDWGILGGSVYKTVCEGVGFSEDVNLTKGESSAEGTVWSASGIILRNGEVKFRMDNVWKVDRRIDPAAGFLEANGYVAQLNVGGTLDVLEEGGANIPFTDANDGGGLYDVSLALDANGGFAATLTRTGDAEACSFSPDNFAWGIIGAATQGTETTSGWSTEKKFIYAGESGGTHTWRGVFPLAGGASDNQFKFRTDDTWATKLIPTNVTVTDDTEAGTITDDGATNGDGQWFVADGKSGFYYMTISTADLGASWSLSIDEAEFQLIGQGSPVGNWDAGNGIAMAFNDDIDPLVTSDTPSATASGAFTTDGWKIFVNQSFDYNLGGALDGTTALLFNADTFVLSSAGNYSITISTADGGQTYTATATAQ